MAPIAVDPPVAAPVISKKKWTPVAAIKEITNTGPDGYNKDIEEGGDNPASYPKYLPRWSKGVSLPPLEPFEYVERGKFADPSFPNLLKEGVTVDDITPIMGAEVRGVQLSQLNDAGKDELALLVAQKRVLAFRDQDFAELPLQSAVDYVAYYGRLHVHPSSPTPTGFPQIHLIHRSQGDKTAGVLFKGRNNSVSWHSDVTYEKQPPGITFLYVLDCPPVGGDTLYIDAAAAYRRLSPAFQKRLHGLKAVHSGFEQAANAKSSGGESRRAPISTIHPLVRTHPATGEKILFYNPQFVRQIVGMKKEESDYLLNFLNMHMALSQDIQCRPRWRPGTVVVWDNRVTSHTAIVDWTTGDRRHLARITPQAEIPYETPWRLEEGDEDEDLE